MVRAGLLAVALLAVALTLAWTGVAQASLILVPGPTPANSFIDLGAQGFGNAPRLLTLQTNTFESGFETPIDVEHGDAVDGANKSTTPTLAAAGWTAGNKVGIGFNSDQSGQTGITLQTLVLTIYDVNAAHTVLGTFSLASPITFTAADLAMQQGNGNAVFNFGLDAAQQAQFNTIVAAHGLTIFAGLGSSLGCAAGAPASCLVSNDGPDTFVAFVQGTGTPIPEPGTLLLLGSGLASVGAWTRRRMGKRS